MQIVIDGNVVSIDPENKTFGEILNAVQEGLKDTDRMVVSVKCDEKILTPEQITAVLQEPADKFEYIEFQTANPKELARDALSASKELLQTTKEQIDLIVEYLPSSPNRAMEIIGDMFTKFNTAHQGIHGTLKLFNIDPASIELSRGNANTLFDRTIEHLTQIKQSLIDKDSSTLADILQYELKPTIDTYLELVDSLSEKV